MSFIANELSDPEIMNALTAEHEQKWGQADKITRQRGAEAAEIIRKYDAGGPCYATLKRLKDLRNEHLAHRQVERTPVEVRGGDATDDEIEAFYQAMATVIRLMLGCVERTVYEPRETAEVFHFYAEFFWAAVRGERTEGHPSYRAPHPLSTP